MEKIIFKYLAGRRTVSLPGIGRFQLVQEAAQTDISEQQLRAPVTTVQYEAGSGEEDYLFTRYVARQLVMPEEKAREQIGAYCRQLTATINQSGVAGISGIGELFKENGNGFSFTPYLQPEYIQPVTAVRAIRQNEVHTIRVGEDEKTNVEMADLLAEPETRKKRWWIAPLIIGLLALGFLAWHFTQSAATGSQQKIKARISHGSL